MHIFSFPNQCRLLHTIETRDNPRGKCLAEEHSTRKELCLGLCELSNNDGSLLVFPFNAKVKGGFVQFLVSQAEDTYNKIRFILAFRI